MTDVVTGAGLFLGDRSQQRRVGGVDGDAVSVWESWLLQTETFGVFAKDDKEIPLPDGLKIWFGPYGNAEYRANRA